MDLDGPRRHEEGLRDLTVGRAFRRQLGDAPLAGSERSDAAERDPPRPRTGRQQLGLGPGDEWRGATDARQLKALSQLLARLGAAVGAAECRAQLGARLGVLEPGGRCGEHLDSLLEQRQPFLAALDQA